MFNPVYQLANLSKACKQWPVKPAFFYHHISNQHQPFHTHLYRAIQVKQFEAELDKLIDCFGYQFHLSFDDGLSSCYHVVKPILKQKGVQATFFINPDFVDNKALFYRYKAALIFNFINGNYKLNTELNQKYKTNILTWVFSVKFSDAHLLDKLADELNLNWATYLREEKPYLTSFQIQALIEDGHLIGAHSMNHPPFYELTKQQQIIQLEESIHWVKQHFNLNYGLFSFPFTDWKVSESVLLHLHQHIKVEQSFGCAGLKQDSFTNHFQRIAMDDNDMPIALRLKKQLIDYKLKKIIGKHIYTHPC